MKPIVCFDFDGVIHSYLRGWCGPRTIPDPPMPGALNCLSDFLEAGYDVVIHSSRARYIGGITAMRNWLRHYAGNQWDTMGPSLCEVRFTRFKPPAVLTIDDRAITFLGTFPSVAEVKAFKPHRMDTRPCGSCGETNFAMYLYWNGDRWLCPACRPRSI